MKEVEIEWVKNIHIIKCHQYSCKLLALTLLDDESEFCFKQAAPLNDGNGIVLEQDRIEAQLIQ